MSTALTAGGGVLGFFAVLVAGLMLFAVIVRRRVDFFLRLVIR